MFKDKELRGYIGAGIIFFLVMGLLLFLAFFQIPDSNNDIFKVIVGMLVGSLSVVIYTFIGFSSPNIILDFFSLFLA